MSEKTLGQVAFEAFRREDDDDIDAKFDWSDMDQAAWEAAADAVVHSAFRSKIKSVSELHVDVIEAARAYYLLWKPDRKEGGLLHERFSVLMGAVEALEAAEKGDAGK